MEPDPRDRAAVRFPPPLIYVASILLGIGLESFVLRLRWVGFYVWARPLAVISLLVAVGMIAAAIGLFRRSGQNPEPWKPTPEILTGGIYRLTRNPMYSGLALLQLALGLWKGNGWIVALVPLSLAAVYWFAVRHEEVYLEGKFGQVYLDYKATVRRWI